MKIEPSTAVRKLLEELTHDYFLTEDEFLYWLHFLTMETKWQYHYLVVELERLEGTVKTYQKLNRLSLVHGMLKRVQDKLRDAIGDMIRQ